MLDNQYVCWEAYIELTGAKPATEGREIVQLDLD